MFIIKSQQRLLNNLSKTGFGVCRLIPINRHYILRKLHQNIKFITCTGMPSKF